MDINKILTSKIFKFAILGAGMVAVLFLVFRVGEAVGFRKAEFSYRFGDGYRNFLGPRPGMPFGAPMPFGMSRPFGGFDGDEFLAGNGTVGNILSVNATSSSFVVSAKDGSEKVILVSTSTIIRAHREDLNFASLKINDSVAVIGAPNDKGQITAKLIRIFNF